MQLERLVIDSGEHTFAADFHPKLTVIGGLDRGARSALAGEVIDSLAGGKPGVHLELETDGRSLTVFRPSTGRHRVIDTSSVQDVTDAYVGADGTIDLFASLGVDRTLAQRAIRLSREDLVLRGATDEYVSRLAVVDQEVLWETAMRLKSANELLEHVSAASGASVTDVELLDVVEQRHAELVTATENYDKVRLVSLTAADIGAIVGLAMAFSDRTTGAIPFLAMAVIGVLCALYFRRTVSRAEAAEREALSGTDADDYTAFQVERVSALLDSDAERRRFMQAVTSHRKATTEWKAIAGDISLAFALDHIDQIRLSADVQSGVRSLQHLSETAPDISADVTAELAQALLNRIEAVRALTPGNEVLPMVVDDAFEDLEPTLKPMLLEMLAASSGAPQVILLTADDDVASWARMEAMGGQLAVVEPTVERSPEPPAAPSAAPSSASSSATA
ncbi:MAG: hypothetical protein OSA99_14720 [Acidimicrobiales bacterium]|nr:hypothetical protein [Acidimicrobiales bacterium]